MNIKRKPECFYLLKNKKTNDFGEGFYCGENLAQAAMFVSKIPESSVYSFILNIENLKCVKFLVERDWMLLISYFRGFKLPKSKISFEDLLNTLKKIRKNG